MRQAIGAARSTLVPQLAVEALLFFAAGQAIGSLLASSATGWLHAFLPEFGIPVRLDLAVDWRVWLPTSVVTLATALLFGVLPAATDDAEADRVPLLPLPSPNRHSPRRRARVVP